jgi:hypothetical protein
MAEKRYVIERRKSMIYCRRWRIRKRIENVRKNQESDEGKRILQKIYIAI